MTIEVETTWDLLKEIVGKIVYRPGWRVGFEERNGVLELQIIAKGFDTHHPERGETYRVLHPFLVPWATYNEQSWTRWVLDRFIEVETHEACEFFRVDGKQPYAPNHGPGWAQYMIREVSRVKDAETTATGVRREGSVSERHWYAGWGDGTEGRPLGTTRIQLITRESGAWVAAKFPGWTILDSDDGMTVEGGTSYLLEQSGEGL